MSIVVGGTGRAALVGRMLLPQYDEVIADVPDDVAYTICISDRFGNE
jgi:hypothetical protein